MSVPPRSIMLAELATTSPDAAVPDAARRVEELGRIILAYSEVTEKLQQSHEQLNRTIESLRRELGEKNRQLERSNRLAALGEMAAGLAHEIRNPLGGIQLYASLLAGDLKDRPEQTRIVEKISTGVKRLESLVGQVLNFSREIRVSPTRCDLADLVRQAVEYAAGTLETRDVRCVVVGPESLTVSVDAMQLGQAVLNLVLNAAEAAEAGGVVTVSYAAARRDNASAADQFVLSVQDTGPGIPADLLDKIFNPFFTTKDAGTGLGLSITHRIIEAHDGTISAANVEGGGARFEVKI